MWEISKVKDTGKTAFKANYWPSVLVAFLMSIFAAGSAASSGYSANTEELNTTITNMTPEQQAALAAGVFSAVAVFSLFSILIRIFLANPLEIGGYTFFKKNIINPPAVVSDISNGFHNYWHNFCVMFVRDLFLALWCMLFLIPGIIKAYSYYMVPFILIDHPEMSATEVITESRRMMNGHKWRAFLLDLSFIGWILLGFLTLGLGMVFFTSPYMYSTHAALYEELKNEQAA